MMGNPKKVNPQNYTAKIELVPIDTLVAYERNARKHSASQVDLIADSLRRRGFLNPILIDGESTIIAGHGRLAAARQIGLKEVPVVRATHLTAEEVKAFRLFDNQSVLLGEWDNELLKVELNELIQMDYDLALTGFSDRDIAKLATWGDNANDPEAVPEPPPIPVSNEGDVWLLGLHRLMCGDCTNAKHVGKLLAGAKPQLMVTDPPYGVEYDANWRNEADRANGKPCGARAIGLVSNDHRASWAAAWKLYLGDIVYQWHAPQHAIDTQSDLRAAGFEVRSQIIWAKHRFVIGRGDYHVQHEPCWYAVRKGKKGRWNGDRSQSTLWQISHQKSETGHGTQKPIECMRRPIENNSKRGESVYDPFVGSGTTIIAAEMTGRHCLALEINPAYVDVCVRRWQDYTGKQATLEGTKKTWGQLSNERLRPGRRPDKERRAGVGGATRAAKARRAVAEVADA